MVCLCFAVKERKAKMNNYSDEPEQRPDCDSLENEHRRFSPFETGFFLRNVYDVDRTSTGKRASTTGEEAA
jgi:hypothetical protein